MIRSFLLAIQFLTILPLQVQGVEQKYLVRSMAFYPLIGALLGAILYLGSSLFHSFFPDSISAILVVLLWTILTGGLHLDGLADTLDGFIGGRDRETTLSIMRDPTIGTMGAIGVFFVLSLKCVVFFLFLEAKQNLLPLLLFVPAVARFLMVYAAFSSRYPHTQGTGKDYIGKIPLGIFLLASTFILLVAIGTLQMKGLILLLASLLGSSLWILFCHRRIGGMTGDTLGALGEVTEAGLLMFMV